MARARATTDEEVYNIEENIEQAVKAGMQAIKSMSVYTPKDLVELPAERVEVEFVLGPAEYPKLPKWRGETQQDKLDADEDVPLVFGTYTGTLTMSIVTTRFDDEPNDALAIKNKHNTYIAKIYDALADEHDIFSETRLPYYEVAEIRPNGHIPTFDEMRTEDRTELQFSIKLQIAPEAFPV